MVDNPLHVDFFVEQTGTGTIKSDPVRFFVQDMALFMSGNLGGAEVALEVSPDDVDVNDPDAVAIKSYTYCDVPAVTALLKTKHVNVVGDYAYVSMHQGYGGFVIFDISDLTAPVYIGHAVSSASVNVTLVDGDYAYAIRNGSGLPGGIEVWDISDKTAPVKVGQVAGTNQLFDAVKVGNYIYAAGSDGDGLVTFDVSDPAVPVETNTIAFNAGGIKAKDGHVFITNYGTKKLQAYDIATDPAAPAFVAEVSVGNFPVPVTIDGDYAYVEDYNGQSIFIISIANVNAMELLSEVFATGTLLNQGSVVPHRNKLRAISGNTLNVWDITDRSNPELLSKQTLPSASFQAVQGKMNLVGGHLILADRSPNRLVVIEVAEDVTWFEHPSGAYLPADFDDPSNIIDWRNADLAEVWVRAVIRGATADTDVTLKSRPRVEMVMNGY